MRDVNIGDQKEVKMYNHIILMQNQKVKLIYHKLEMYHDKGNTKKQGKIQLFRNWLIELYEIMIKIILILFISSQIIKITLSFLNIILQNKVSFIFFLINIIVRLNKISK